MKKNITIGEKYDPAMVITGEKEALEYFEALVTHTMSFGHSRKVAEEIERKNLRHYAGYYDAETRKRVEELFNYTHPILGKTNQTVPTAEEAIEEGKKPGFDYKHAV